MNDGMSKTEEFLFGVREKTDETGKPLLDVDGGIIREDVSAEEIETNLGVVPTPDSIRRVMNRLHGFGSMGVKGFDLAIATFKILRGEQGHEIFKININGQDEEFQRPFTFVTPAETKNQTDHGILNGYTYGLNVLSRTMPDVDLYDFKATKNLRVIAENRASGNALIAHSVDTSQELVESSMEFGYFGHFPNNAASVAGYLVLPRPDAIDVVNSNLVAQA